MRENILTLIALEIAATERRGPGVVAAKESFCFCGKLQSCCELPPEV